MTEINSKNKNGEDILIRLGEDRSTDITAVGGKGASLGKMVKAGFPVPSGFVVTTSAYLEFLKINDLEVKIEKILDGIDYDNIDELEKKTGKIREEISNSKLPESFIQDITRAYKELGEEMVYVAIRSSATAEDLEGSSFAGQYETYLDVRGEKALLDALLQCWASMWTVRVTAYRHNKGFDHTAIGIAVVIQKMVEPDVAGVMFVGNPMNARADEVVINASWGLGETVVSGRITPDEFVVARDTLQIKHRTLGSKKLSVVRNQNKSVGTIEKSVPDKLQNEYSLSDKQISELTELGRRITSHYNGLPQDIEWAMEDDSFFLLQSRPVTGVEFTWEEDLDLWPSLPEDDNLIWSRKWADEVWTGAITPLMWSVRGRWMRDGGSANYQHFEMGELAELRAYKYHHGTVYYNTRADELIAEYCLPPNLRAHFLNRLHPSQLERATNAPFDLWRTLKMFVRIEETQPGMGIGNFSIGNKVFKQRPKSGIKYEFRRKSVKAAFPDLDQIKQEIRALKDEELRPRVMQYNNIFASGVARGAWGIIHIYAPVIRALLDGVLRYWYNGDNPNAFIETLSGIPEQTQQFNDDYAFWELAEMIRHSKKLHKLFEEFKGAAFFDELKNHEEGHAFLAKYEEFLEVAFYRGHADRDIYFDRRIEDPSLDYEALGVLLKSEGIVSPDERENKLNQRRELATAEVIENLSKQPLGDIKVFIFRFLMNYSLRFFMGRDDSRPMSDIVTYQKKLVLCEYGHRTVSRGLLEGERDFYFLSIDELDRLLTGTEPNALARAKVVARRKWFDLFLTHEEDPPLFLKGNIPMDDKPTISRGDVLKGVGTAPGVATGRARIIPTLEEIGQLEKGDILVCHGTDPGWTSAFSVVAGVIAQTGGMLAHFSCLSREYGLPAVSLPNAIKLIKDESIITVNGDNGDIRLVTE
ncbi:MAG: PEP/pyruvate-binding domain-containing protein [Promethearchaeota archaeon]|jgi:pyruvate,water dikinase